MSEYQLLPTLTGEEFAALRDDIAQHGIRVPIDVDEDGVILDGHHRSMVAAELGIEVPRRTVIGLTEQGKRNHARAVNAIRRHLSVDARRDQVRQMRAEGQTIAEIATTLGVSYGTAHSDVASIRTDIQDESITTATGAQRPGSYAPRTVDPEPKPDSSGLSREQAESLTEEIRSSFVSLYDDVASLVIQAMSNRLPAAEIVMRLVQADRESAKAHEEITDDTERTLIEMMRRSVFTPLIDMVLDPEMQEAMKREYDHETFQPYTEEERADLLGVLAELPRHLWRRASEADEGNEA